MKFKLSRNNRKILSVYITFFLFLIAEILIDPSILRTQGRLWPLSLQFVPLMLCAMSQGCIMLMGGINLALGSSLSLLTAIASQVMFEGVPGIIGGSILTILSGGLIGALMGVIVTYGRLPDIIVTLAFSYVWSGAALILLPKPGGHIPESYSSFMSSGGILPPAIIILFMCLIIWRIFKSTKMGVDMYAVGGNAKASFENGVNVNKVKILAYFISGLFLGVAGLVLVGQTGCGDPTVGNAYGTNSIASAVLGGFSFLGGEGQMRGAVMGAFIFTALVNVLFFSGLSSFYQYIVQGLILIVAIGLTAISHYIKGGDRA